MTKKITYLFGAGASAYSLPVVADLFPRLVEFKFRLINEKDHVDDPEAIDMVVKEIEWLLEQAGGHYTIDTLAKKFYLVQNYQDLTRLKHCLVLYFTLEQFIFIPSDPQGNYRFTKSAMDVRYSSFIAALARPFRPHPKLASENDFSIVLNEKVAILSWNYDVQFELSLQRTFMQEKKILYTQNAFQIFPNEHSLCVEDNCDFDSSKFAMIKLNGNAIWNEIALQGPRRFTQTIFDTDPQIKDKITLLNYFLARYKEFTAFRGTPRQNHDPTEMLNFAWENDNEFRHKYSGHSMNLKRAERVAGETQILVVIGYSFPIFNRSIDKVLFKKMNMLEKVYVQDPNPEQIKSTMENAFSIFQQKKSLPPGAGRLAEEPLVKFFLEKNTNQFVIPFELDQ